MKMNTKSLHTISIKRRGDEEKKYDAGVNFAMAKIKTNKTKIGKERNNPHGERDP